jgi:hypothetical protein
MVGYPAELLKEDYLMLIKSFHDEVEGETLPIIEGECVVCEAPNSLIIKSNKIISQKTSKISFTCLSCKNNFNYIIKEDE